MIAFLGYEARTGLNPTANIRDLVKVCIVMWAGNNVTRPFRLAGAAGLAPAMDRVRHPGSLQGVPVGCGGAAACPAGRQAGAGRPTVAAGCLLA